MGAQPGLGPPGKAAGDGSLEGDAVSGRAGQSGQARHWRAPRAGAEECLPMSVVP